MGLAAKEASPEVLQWLAARPWPGNVRELENFVRRLAVFATNERVDMALVRTVLEGGVQMGPARVGATPPPGLPLAYKEAKAAVVHDFTLEYVRGLLTRTQGNVSEAARLSGLSRVALQKILARTGERAADFR